MAELFAEVGHPKPGHIKHETWAMRLRVEIELLEHVQRFACQYFCVDSCFLPDSLTDDEVGLLVLPRHAAAI